MEKLVLSRPEVAGKLQKWSIKLGEYDIQYRPRTSVKGQILADFIVERPEDDPLDNAHRKRRVTSRPLDTVSRTDHPCVDGSGAGLILTNQEGAEFTYALRFRYTEVKTKKADALSKIASTSFSHLTKQVLVEELNEKSINEAEVLAVVEEEGDTWMTPIYNYLTEETLPTKKKARSVQQVQDVTLINQRDLAVCMLDKIRGIKAIRRDTTGQSNARGCKDKPFKDWCEKVCIRQCFASIKNPQTNGLMERANRSLGEGIKARLDERSKDWIEEIPYVLWAHRTIKSSNGDTPFSLTYGTEAVIPAEIDMPTLRTTEIDMVQNYEALEINLDLLEERREQAAIREARSKAKIEKYNNSKVHNTSFKPGDLMYRNNDASHAKDSEKLSPKWEGPYEVTKALGNGAYKLRDRNEKPLL
ncbi:reverse transcriptase domain-containing protein [Tanacetum coccineum]